ncbi:Fe2+-dependent dioxygenase [Prochlorococcus marinus]|uniref:Fe2+-dependent dioxygenase n=1 Tax=Prochlorococcus marinus XMU1408 TaxID=2213228 RepID=A0A318QYC5_PROMR|nr:Fe2+-dependent dioxygenase [Prochlorococcus marinus]MBW3042389.1 Fe2+-dependent dioxygenase [Prochlorococcus marinus str. XMU1408]PYE01124.1 Fe2+-dependent dioxygenase [Prochlorococcus marinus XMU1408]
MEYLTHSLIDKSEAQQIVKKLKAEKNSWQDGKKTAGSYAAKIKNNFQLDRNSELSIELRDIISNKIISNPLLKSFTLPSLIHGLMLTKSLAGHGYGIHIDNPYMPSGRSDLSFTLFLNDAKDYKGGELCIQKFNKTENIKLSAGEIIIYPSTQLHSVAEIKEGERYVCVGWIQSYVQSNEDRNFLFGLDAGAKRLLSKHGRSDELDLIFQAYSNLLRRLGD